MANYTSIMVLFFTFINLFILITAIPVAENADTSLEIVPTEDSFWFTTNTLPEGATVVNLDEGIPIINITAPANSTILPRGDPMKQYLQGLSKQFSYSGPYCTKSLDPNTCTFATRVGADHQRAELYAYDHWCNRIGYWTDVAFPMKDLSFFTELKYAIVVTQVWGSSAPWMWYAGRASGWGYSQTWCYNGGQSGIYPGFRLACRTNFSC